jgi:hypothetical protein
MSDSFHTAYVEHVNATVQDVDLAVRYLTTALPEWGVRGGGTMDWYGKPMRWVHVGSDAHYIALQSGGEGPGVDWRGSATGIKHVGIVVPSLHAVVERLAAAGFALDHWGGETAHRKSVYFMLGDDFQLEFVEYRTPDPALRNVYA